MNGLWVIGYPGDLGGANTECWHTVKLWRRLGLPVTLIPTWSAPDAWRRRLEAIGCRTVESTPGGLGRVEGLAGSVVVALCNRHFLRAAPRFRELGCTIVWLNCMTRLLPEERKHYAHFGPFDAYVFQSRFQQTQLQAPLARFGVRPEQCHRIRGAFDAGEFPFTPHAHAPGEPLVVGRLSRASADKYAADTWAIYGRIPYPIRARVMAWDRRIEEKVGPAPDWAECLPAEAESPRDFLGSLHCLLPINGGARENWPRAGLEAMARGVPIVAENRWGWPEMVRHGETGLLGDTPEDLAFHAGLLARDERLRLRIARRAREVLEAELADPRVIGRQWQKLLGAAEK